VLYQFWEGRNGLPRPSCRFERRFGLAFVWCFGRASELHEAIRERLSRTSDRDPLQHHVSLSDVL
ncbi:hypothetical protein RGC27_08345, partial [Helicobacter pylori]|uniref:hypothetical protein n=1 Tax=Helicobacter pylori TaxID=210 RepID=UPI0029291AD0